MPSGVYQGNKGKKLTQEHKDKLAAAHRGKHHSQETKDKMRDTNIETYRKKRMSNAKDMDRVYG